MREGDTVSHWGISASLVKPTNGSMFTQPPSWLQSPLSPGLHTSLPFLNLTLPGLTITFCQTPGASAICQGKQ